MFDPDELKEALAQERQAVADFAQALELIRNSLPFIGRWGDGRCGYVLSEVHRVVDEEGFGKPPATLNKGRRKPLAQSVRRQVYERDEYRCVTCGTHKDLTVDHIIAVIRGGGNGLSNLQTMCRPCNSSKGARQ